jgi:hypothetical protein
VEVETTIQELANASIATLGGVLKPKQRELLTRLRHEETISYEAGVPRHDWPWIVPLRNAGIVETEPQGAYLEEAQCLKLSPLGTLVVKAMKN